MDIIGLALLDYQSNQYTEDITTYSSIAGDDILPLPYLFRDFSQMPKIEQKALKLTNGKTLDIGCGAGVHSMWLQQKGVDVVALDSSPGAVAVCKNKGIHKVVLGAINDCELDTFDTLLLLMNGVGLAGTLKNLPNFLNRLKGLLNPGGQILLDSSDIIYMFESDDDGGYWIDASQEYYGNVVFSMEYKLMKGPDFPWLYVDFEKLKTIAKSCGLFCELMQKGPHFDYLAKLTRL